MPCRMPCSRCDQHRWGGARPVGGARTGRGPAARPGRRFGLVFMLAVAVACVPGRGEKLPGDRRPGRRPAAGTAGRARRRAAPAAAGGSSRRVRSGSGPCCRTLDAAALDEMTGAGCAALAAAGRLEGPAERDRDRREVAARRRRPAQVELFAAMLHDGEGDDRPHRIPEDTNEITQVRELLGPVGLTGAVVTADAAHAQHDTAGLHRRGKASGLPAHSQGQPARTAACHLRHGQRRLRHRPRPRRHRLQPRPDHPALHLGHQRRWHRVPPRRPGHADPPRHLRPDRDRPGQGGAITASPAWTQPAAPPQSWPASPRASGASSQFTGSGTPPTPKTPIPDMPETGPRSWPRCGTSPSACSTWPASPRSPGPSSALPETGPGHYCSSPYKTQATNDFADPVGMESHADRREPGRYARPGPRGPHC